MPRRTRPKFGKEDWRNAASAVGAGGDRVVVVTPDDGRMPLSDYLDGRTFPLEGPDVRVAEIAVVAGATREPGSITEARPPRGPTPTAPAGFELRSWVNARYYTVVVYRAAAKRWVSRRALVSLALARDPELVVERR